MGEVERLRRPLPQRTHPIRNMSALAGKRGGEAETPAGDDARPGPEPGEARGQGAPRAVGLGYRVIEDYIRQGQEAARAAASGVAGGFGAAGSFQALTERMLRDGLVWLEYLAKMWAAIDPPRRHPPEDRKSVAQEPAAGFRVRLASPAEAEVAVDLHASADGRSLAVHDLRSPDPEAPAIAGVEIERAPDAGGWRVAVRVPDDQPAGLYSGIVYDRGDGSIRGTVSVRVEPAAAAP